MKNKYPIYIISKGRWESRLTSKTLEKMNVPYHIVIEPQEYDEYSKVINKEKILILPFSNLGKGSIPARNWVWEDSVSKGFKKHWILDDNIRNIYRLNKGKRNIFNDIIAFETCENFTDRYLNVALSGMNYYMFGIAGLTSMGKPVIQINTRIYSCILINNSIPYRWRGIYNEDTDISLRVLKGGYCTILFNIFLIGKQNTMTMKGGNTDQLYEQDKEFDGRLEMVKSLRRQHPDVTKITRKWGRWQHSVDYRPFKKNKLIKRKDIIIDTDINNYGME